MAALEKNLAITTRDYEDTNRSSEALKAKYERQQESLNSLDTQISALRDEISDCQTNRQEKEGAVNVLKEQIIPNIYGVTHTSQRMEVLEKSRRNMKTQLEEEQKKRQEMQPRKL